MVDVGNGAGGSPSNPVAANYKYKTGANHALFLSEVNLNFM